MKNGIKTTEFWLTLLAHVLAGLQVLLLPGGVAERVVALAVLALAQLGYTAGRSVVKANEQKAIAATAISLGAKSQSPSL